MREKIRIAIDGPSGAGKSTIAKAVARELGIDYVDTGAMYRAIGLKMTSRGMAMEESEALQKMLDETDIDFRSGDVILDGQVVSDRIRTPEISMAASACSALAMVRSKLVELQQKMGREKSIIMDGRDICEVVLPDAELKYYLTASAEERARRRTAELIAKGEKVNFDQVLADIEMRDYNDSHRAVTPLRRAEDAEEIDSTSMTIDEVVGYICSRARAARA
ncbi:MAG: (d)CMP kinase [Anaerovoracaceae bacterium]